MRTPVSEEPGQKVPEQGSEVGGERVSLWRILALARPEWLRLSLATFFLLISAGFGLAMPQFVGRVIDGLNQSGGVELVDNTTILMLLLFAVMGVATGFRAYLFNVAGERILTNLRVAVFRSLVSQEIGFFDQQKTGDLLSRLGSDTTVLQNTVTVNLSMALRFGLTFVGAISIMAWRSLQLTGVMLAVVPVVTIGAAIYVRILRRVSRQVRDAVAECSSVAEESLAGIRTVRAFAREDHEGKRYSDASEKSFELARYRAWLGATFQGVMSFAGYAAVATVLWYGGRLVARGDMTLGHLSEFILYTFALAFSLSALSSLWGDFAKALGASERVFELLDRESTLPSGMKKIESLNGKLELRGVHFRYPARPDVEVLKAFDLLLEPGQSLALVGHSGAGKSTVAALVSRFYDVSSGTIAMDDVNYRELDLDWLREQIGVVSQEPLLFATSIADNLRYGKIDATDAELEEAARAANAHEFIMEFSEGYETLVGERGVRLSGGQKQRIAIARAILKSPKILVLDEATSALDAENEHVVQEALDRLQEGRTTLIIAHRLSTVQNADKVAVVDGGQVVQLGPHEELVATDGIYRSLVARQLGVPVNTESN